MGGDHGAAGLLRPGPPVDGRRHLRRGAQPLHLLLAILAGSGRPAGEAETRAAGRGARAGSGGDRTHSPRYLHRHGAGQSRRFGDHHHDGRNPAPPRRDGDRDVRGRPPKHYARSPGRSPSRFSRSASSAPGFSRYRYWRDPPPTPSARRGSGRSDWPAGHYRRRPSTPPWRSPPSAASPSISSRRTR